MRTIVRRLIAPVVAASALAVGFGAAPAQAASTQTLCGAGGVYVNEAIMQTRTQWGRAGERVCWEYSDTQVRARGQFRIDWPSECTLSLGYKEGAVSCPLRTYTKLGRLTFYTVQIPLRWAGPDGRVHTGTCTWKDQTAFDMSSKVWTCSGPWMPIQKGGRYFSGLGGAGGDVKNDGDGLKVLSPVGRHLTFT